MTEKITERKEYSKINVEPLLKDSKIFRITEKNTDHSIYLNLDTTSTKEGEILVPHVMIPNQNHGEEGTMVFFTNKLEITGEEDTIKEIDYFLEIAREALYKLTKEPYLEGSSLGFQCYKILNMINEHLDNQELILLVS